MNRLFSVFLGVAAMAGPLWSSAAGVLPGQAPDLRVEAGPDTRAELPFLLSGPSLRAGGDSFPGGSLQEGAWSLGGGSRFGWLARGVEQADYFVGVEAEIPLSSATFLQSRSMVESTGSGSLEEGFRQVLGYGIRFLDSETMRFDVVPGFVRTYGRFDPSQGAPVWTGNLSQSFVWLISENLAIQQNVSSFVEQFEDDSVAAVLNFDLETLLSDRLSFRVSYEVEYEDVLGDEFDKRNTRLSTAVGYRF